MQTRDKLCKVLCLLSEASRRRAHAEQNTAKNTAHAESSWQVRAGWRHALMQGYVMSYSVATASTAAAEMQRRFTDSNYRPVTPDTISRLLNIKPFMTAEVTQAPIIGINCVITVIQCATVWYVNRGEERVSCVCGLWVTNIQHEETNIGKDVAIQQLQQFSYTL